MTCFLAYGLNGWGSIPDREDFSSTPQHPDRVWGPPSFLSNGNCGLFPRGSSDWDLKVTTQSSA
jgi:hypothetical protein